MKPTDLTKQHVIQKYVKPARSNGESIVQVRVGNVQKELGWTNRTPSVFSTLSSRGFQQEAGLELIERKGGPPSGGPSTTVQFVYRLLKDGDRSSSPLSAAKPIPSGAGRAHPTKPTPVPNGSGLKALYGILAHTFRELGGGETFLKSERASWGPDPWEKLELERRKDAE